MESITAQALSAHLASNPHSRVIDVREQEELSYGMIAGAEHIPMQTIPTALPQLGDKTQQVLIIVCHAGVRSLHVAQYLEQQGFQKVFNLLGGMNSWALEVDNTVTVY